MAIHDKFVTLAVRLIKKHGRPLTFIELSNASDPARAWEGTDTAQSNPTRTLVTVGVQVEPDSLQRLGLTIQLSDLVQRSDKVMMVPGPDDLIGYNQAMDEGSYYSIIQPFETLRPGVTTVLHFVGLKL